MNNADQIGDRLKIYRESLRMSQTDFAKTIGVKQGAISDIERGRIKVSSAMAELLSKETDIDLNWLFGGAKSATKNDDTVTTLHRHSTPNFSKSSEKHRDFNTISDIPLPDLLEGKYNLVIPAKARAGYAMEWTQEYLEDQIQLCRVPGITGRARTFEVIGDSMEPVIQEGDFISCTEINRYEDLEDGKLYAIISRESGVYIKYIQKTTTGLNCISSNADAHKPFFMPYKDVTEMWEAKVKLIYDLYSDKDRHLMPVLVNKMHEMEQFMRKQFDNFPKEDEEPPKE